MNTDYNLDTTAKAVQKAVHTMTLNFFSNSIYIQKGVDLLGKINRWKWFLCMARFILDNKVGGYRCRSQVPEHEILKIVRMYAPIITEFFDNEEEMAKFQK